MIEGLQIERFNPTEENAVALAATYAKVFAGAPWNEVTKCIGCNRFYGSDTEVGQICRGVCGGSKLEEAYPLMNTAEDLVNDSSREGAAASVLLKNSRPVGFAIGFPYYTDEFIEERYKTAEGREQMQNLFTALKQPERSFYISEVGLEPEFRGQGFSNQLVDYLTDRATLLNLGLLMRTNRESPMIAVARREQMRQIMGPEVAISEQYAPNGGDMKLVRKIISSGEPVNIMDPENAERVLFIAPWKVNRARTIG